ncbi:M1 family metallopeptidase [Methylococcus sp. EFPC2]|uniref:M1 family metallopeptidase n=1 Tax=Methylococcus sp. EFPC2 TaxID=2812648 RepID=UPI0019675B71|nr:M1 family metallopeptidase [Methylococcus sp. EFPC2]QSA96442.1 M1 family metallopeptidase [Methylococcus sp. EFPC2]
MHRHLLTATVLAVLAQMFPAAHAVAAPPAADEVPTQLPRNVRPTHYDVAIVPDIKGLSFTGKVAIAIEVLEPSSRIVLNAADLAFGKVSLSNDSDGTVFAAPAVQADAAAQTATFTFDRSIPQGRYRLDIDYSGKIGTQAAGLFALDYDTPEGARRALYTQFESSDARRLIPSWDEPAHKATFRLEVTVPAGLTAIGNTPVEETFALGKGLARVRFATTPRMSTYLLFFGLGEFDRATAQSGATEIGVVTRKGGAAQAAFALESSRALLTEYNDYFGTPYPLSKLDNVAAPGRSQFFSAMENWGAIFTFEHSILLDPTISNQADKQQAFSVAAHEMAHQWFGDLVTMAWWDDLWLNESFASWMDSRTTAHLHPEWRTELRAVGGRERAMELDALASTHPVVQPVKAVEEIAQAFDAITYQKGEAVIRMLEAYVGADAWREGIRRYMKDQAYRNTQSDDLWRALETVADKPIAAIARDFTLQPGAPLIEVDEAVCRGGRSHLSLKQGEFSKDRPDKKPLAWRVPVIVRSLGDAAPASTLVTGGRADITVPGCGSLIVNAGQSGYYRTLYAPGAFAGIVRNFAAIAPIDQLGILSDTWALGLSGRQSAADFLDLVEATPVDAEPQVWGRIAGVFRSIDEYYRGEPSRQAAFRAYAVARLRPVLERVGWAVRENEPDPVAILRNELIDTLGSLQAPEAIAEARRLYAAQKTEASALPAALRKTVLGVVARHADGATWDELHAAATAEKTPLIKDRFYALLGATEDEGLARRALDLALTNEPGATNSAAIIQAVARLHPDLAFDYAVAHREAVNERLDGPSRNRFFPRIAEASVDPAMIGKVKAYAEEHIAPGARRAADTAVASIAYRIKVRRERLALLDGWLARSSH